MVVEVGVPVEMTATHTLKAADDDACTIAARGQRALEEEPFVQEVGQARVSNKLGGSSEVMLRTVVMLNEVKHLGQEG